MICLGNICRSPLAQGVMESLCKANHLDWQIDSAGTASWHAGNPPDPRSIKIARNKGLDITAQRARQLQKADLDKYDLLLVMDQENYNNVLKMCHNDAQKSKVQLILNYAYPNENRAVPDPYYDDSFDHVYELLVKSCSQLLVSHQ